ncbi:hypothetical protein QOZ91_001418 [Clostridium sardiniense]|nr:hypothetical protein [Clostridium sardiniense]
MDVGGDYVDTVWKNMKKIKECIVHKLEKDRLLEYLTIDNIDSFKSSR